MPTVPPPISNLTAAVVDWLAANAPLPGGYDRGRAPGEELEKRDPTQPFASVHALPDGGTGLGQVRRFSVGSWGRATWRVKIVAMTAKQRDDVADLISHRWATVALGDVAVPHLGLSVHVVDRGVESRTIDEQSRDLALCDLVLWADVTGRPAA